VPNDKKNTYDNFTALDLLASQNNYLDRVACAFQRLATSGVDEILTFSSIGYPCA
jgi:hypothetical protein